MSTPATFPVQVEGIGNFVFRKRQYGDQIWIENKAVEILGGPALTPQLQSVALATATLIRLTVPRDCPWNVETLDPLDDDATPQLWKVYGELRLAEDRFRKGAGEERPVLGAGGV